MRCQRVSTSPELDTRTRDYSGFINHTRTHWEHLQEYGVLQSLVWGFIDTRDENLYVLMRDDVPKHNSSRWKGLKILWDAV